MKNFSTKVFYGTANHEEFINGIQLSVNQVTPAGIFTGDNLFTYGRTLSFLDDTDMMAAFEKSALTDTERSLIWRFHTACWGARNGLRLEGDFVDCACGLGSVSRMIADTLKLATTSKALKLYDNFEFPVHNTVQDKNYSVEELFDYVTNRFADLPQVQVNRGLDAASLEKTLPEKISFLHLDQSMAELPAESLALLFERLVSGAVVVFNEYGWLGYEDLRQRMLPFFTERGYHILELPTGQGLLIK